MVRRRPVVKKSRPEPRVRPLIRNSSQSSHGAQIVRQAVRHLREIYIQRDSAHFVHQIFTECGLVYPYVSAGRFPPFGYFMQVRRPVLGDIVLYAEHIGIYGGSNKMICVDPGPEKVCVSLVSGYLNFVGFYRWYQDYRDSQA